LGIGIRVDLDSLVRGGGCFFFLFLGSLFFVDIIQIKHVEKFVLKLVLLLRGPILDVLEGVGKSEQHR